MRARAYVLARKGVLISNPDVKNMSLGQWLFEYHALQKAEHSQFETFFKVFKEVIVGLFGLNAIKPEDANGIPKKPDEMSEDERGAFLPLVHWIARPEMLKVVADQMKHLELPAPDPDKNYEELVAAIDSAGGDADPILGQLHNIDMKNLPKNPVMDQQAKQLGIMDIKDGKIKLD